VSRVHIGIDVGGTNTDAVVVAGRQVRATAKRPTTPDVTTGIVAALEDLLRGGLDPGDVAAVMIGTTHFVNAFVQARELLPTAVVRLCGTATRALPPMTDWPAHLARSVTGRVFLVAGGHEYDGREIASVDPEELACVADEILAAGLRTVAITSVFSPVNDAHEIRAAEILAAALPGVDVSISSEIGRIGLLERENATIVNAALRGLAGRIVAALEEAVGRFGIEAPVYLSQNDGTLMQADHVGRYPVATFASGPTNSMRGAAFLSAQADCAVVDIGGTTTDIGVLRHGFPREASLAVEIGGIRTNFRMPDVLSLGIGGGSLVRADGEVTVGPDSVGFRLTEEALVFGGATLTATDVAVAAGLAEIGDPERVRHLDRGVVRDALARIRHDLAEALDRMKLDRGPVPVVVVGGGSILLDDTLPGASAVVRPEHFPVANAIGAAIAQVGGQIDRIVSLATTPREHALEQARRDARERCLEAGALPESVRIVEVEEVPLAYLPSNAVRLKVKAVGDLDGGHRVVAD